MNTRVCIISPKPPMLQYAKQLKLDVVCVYTPEEFCKLPNGAIDDEICLVCQHHRNPDKLVECIRALHDQEPFAATMTVQEEGVITTALLNDALGLNGVSSDTVNLLTDKWQMRQHLAKSGSNVVQATIASSLEEIKEFGAAQGYPLIAKPLGGSASVGIHKINSAQEAQPVFDTLCELDLKHFLLEEYLDGPEISVDAISFNGHHVPIAIADKVTGTNFVEFGHVIPAQLTPSVEEQVCHVISDFLDVIGLSNGLSHTELKLTSDGPRIIESHNRRGGDRINTMTKAVYNIDLEESGLAWAAGLLSPLSNRPTANGAASVAFFEATPGHLITIEGVDEVRSHPNVIEFHLNFKAGDIIPQVCWSLDRAGYVVVTAKSASAARELAQSLASKVRFVTDPESPNDNAQVLSRNRNLIAELNQVTSTQSL